MAYTPSEQEIRNWLDYQQQQLNSGADPFNIVNRGDLTNSPIDYNNAWSRKQAIDALNQADAIKQYNANPTSVDPTGTKTAASASDGPTNAQVSPWTDPNWAANIAARTAALDANDARIIAAQTKGGTSMVGGQMNPTTVGGVNPWTPATAAAANQYVPGRPVSITNPISTTGQGMNEATGPGTAPGATYGYRPAMPAQPPQQTGPLSQPTSMPMFNALYNDQMHRAFNGPAPGQVQYKPAWNGSSTAAAPQPQAFKRGGAVPTIGALTKVIKHGL